MMMMATMMMTVMMTHRHFGSRSSFVWVGDPLTVVLGCRGIPADGEVFVSPTRQHKVNSGLGPSKLHCGWPKGWPKWWRTKTRVVQPPRLVGAFFRVLCLMC